MKAEYKYCVYLITNILNNKVYIGKTSSDTDRRWKDHIRTAQDDLCEKQAIHKAMAKYGIDNFEFSVLKYFKSENAAYKAEIKYIKKYNSYATDYGYNQTPGGKAPGIVARKLEPKIVRRLIKDYASDPKISCHELKEKYRLAKPCILDILHGRSYLNIKTSDDVRYQVWLKLHRDKYEDMDRTNCNFQKFKSDEIISLFNDFVINNFSIEDLANKYKMRPGNVLHILRRHTNNHVIISEEIINKCFEKLKEENLFIAKNRKQSTQNRVIIKNGIFEDFKNGMSKKDISIKYKLNINWICKILNGSKWQNVILTPEYSYLVQSKITQITNDSAFNIIKDYCNDESISNIIEKYNTNKNVVRGILSRKTFAKIDIEDLQPILTAKTIADKIGTIKVIKFSTSDETIVSIFKAYAYGDFTRKISEDFKLHRSLISDILHRRTHQHVVIDSDLEEQVKAKLISNRSGKNKK